MIRKHSVTIRGHRTSVSLEEEFWRCLLEIAEAREETVAALISSIDEQRQPEQNLSSAARLFVLDWYRVQASSNSSVDPDDIGSMR